MKKLYFLFLLTSFMSFSQNPGDIVITEIMNNPDPLTDTTGEWFEIYNTTGSDIDIVGWTLKDDGTDTYVIVAGGESGTGITIVSAGGYLVLGRSDNAAENGGAPVDYSYGTSGHTLGNGTDEIVLITSAMVEIARVNYDGGTVFPDPAGASMALDPSALNETDNDNGANWCESTDVYGDGTGSLGTPGAVNASCTPVCEAALGASDAICDTTNPGATDDTFTASLAFSGAATGETFVVSVLPEGTVDLSAGNPTTDVSGVITITGITEGTDITITIDNTGDGGLCTLTRDIASPTCVPTGSVDLELQGVIDFGLTSSDGKAIHVVATADILDLSVYGIGVANNGGGTDGEEYTFDPISVSNGDHILVARNLAAIEAYLTTPGYSLFDHVLVANSSISQNGDDAIELFKNGVAVEAFGDVNSSGAGQSWEYTDSWAYKTSLGSTWPSGWSYGTNGCAIEATTFDSTCVYPFVSSLGYSDFESNIFSLFPNPANGIFVYITSKSSSLITVAVYDLLGKQVDNSTLINNKLNISELNSGIYILKISQDDNFSTKKIIIK